MNNTNDSGRLERRATMILACLSALVLSLAACSGGGGGPTEDVDTTSSTSGPVTSTPATTTPTVLPVATTTTLSTTTSTPAAVTNQVVVTIDAEGLRVEPADSVQGPPGGIALLVVNDTNEPQQIIYIDIFAGSPEDLPVVDGLVDVSRCNQIFGEEEEDPSPATFGCFGSLGEANPIEVVQLAPGETLPLDDGVQPGTHLIIDHQPGGYETGRYVAFDVLEANTSVGIPATSFDEIAGAYEKPTGEFGYLEIFTDGTLLWAGSRDDPDQAQLAGRFDNGVVLITDPDCEAVEGRYMFHVGVDGSIDLVLVEDSCPGRAAALPGHYDPLR